MRIYTRRNAELAVSCGVCLSIREGNVCGLGVWTKKEMLLKFRNGYGFGTKKQKEEFLVSMAEAKVACDNEKHEINRLLSSRIQTIYLIGSKDVQKALGKFLDIFTTG